MGDRFDKLLGSMEIVWKEKTYPIAISLRQKAMLTKFRGKGEEEKVLMILHKCFIDGYLEEGNVLGTPRSVEQLTLYENEIDKLFLKSYEELQLEVLIALGSLTREQVTKMKEQIDRLTDNDDFLSETVSKKMRA